VNKLFLTPSQTVGPFFTIGLSNSENQGQMASRIENIIEAKGNKIAIRGRVLDGENNSVPDALIEIRQADADGCFENEDFPGFARAHTGHEEPYTFEFHTIKPGSKIANHAPCIAVVVYMRGLLTHLHTRIYFPDEEAANEQDLVLNQVPESRRKTLIAKPSPDQDLLTYEFDIVMQGENETVFFQA